MALTLSDVKFWEAMGEEISIPMDFFVCHFKIALPNFYGIPTKVSIIFFHFLCNQLPQLWHEMQIRPFESPTGI